MARHQASWLHTPFVEAIVAALGADSIKFVGGAVRDSLLDAAVTDIDAATSHQPTETTKLLKAAGFKVIPTGLKHGTVTAVLGQDMMEITTLRLDVKTDGRHADVTFTKDWLLDAKRRDFTFNAIYLAPDGTVFDPFSGFEDLKAGKVRFIGNAEDRIEEDALRILRFFRFYARFGRGDADAAALAACGEKRCLIKNLSIERVREELLKIVTVSDPRETLALLEKTGILAEIIGPSVSLALCNAYIASEIQLGDRLPSGVNPLVRLYFLLRPSMRAARMASHFKMSNAEGARLRRIARAFEDSPIKSPVQLRRVMYNFGREAAMAAVLVAGCTEDALYQLAVDWDIPTFPLLGRDLIELGYPAGPEIGKQIKRLEKTWCASDFKINRSALLELARRNSPSAG